MTFCPYCGTTPDTYAAPLGSSPNPPDGSFAVCASCGSFVVVAVHPCGITLRRPTEAQVFVLAHTAAAARQQIRTTVHLWIRALGRRP